MRRMPNLRWILPTLLLAVLLVAPTRAHAFGGTAAELARPGNFVVSNRANLGFTQGLSYAGATIDLGPELDYMVVPGLSLGAAALFHWQSADGHAAAGVVPQVGYDVTLSSTWSLWPRLAVTLWAGQPPGDWLTMEISAPFLVHPAQHFFFGFGPALSLGVAGNNRTDALYGTFLVGGYFDS